VQHPQDISEMYLSRRRIAADWMALTKRYYHQCLTFRECAFMQFNKAKVVDYLNSQSKCWRQSVGGKKSVCNNTISYIEQNTWKMNGANNSGDELKSVFDKERLHNWRKMGARIH
jgi:hypothetical protein